MKRKKDCSLRDNGYGIVPFTHGFSGFGHEHMPTAGYTNSYGAAVAGSAGPAPEDMAVGLLAGVTDSILALDEMNTALTHLVQLATYTQYFTNENAEGLARKMADAGYGGFIHVDGDPARALQPTQIPQMGAWVSEQINRLYRDIDDGTFQGAIAGQSSPNVPTATGQAMQVGQIFLKFGMPLRQLGLMAGELLGFCARMTALRGESVTIDGITCGADDFEGNYDFEVDFMAKNEGQMLRDTAAALDRYAKGAGSFEDLQRAMGETDVTGRWTELMLSNARKSDQYQEAVLTNAIQIVQQRLADKKAKEAAAKGMPLQTNPTPHQGFTQMQDGPQEAQQVQQTM